VGEEKVIAFCGIDCAACPAYVGTQAGDMELLANTAAEWSSDGEQLTAEDLICYTCLQTEKHIFKWCVRCRMKDCCREKGIPNCAHCDEYACEDLKKLWNMVESQEPRKTLDHIRWEVTRL
jgi:hypothetical protein